MSIGELTTEPSTLGDLLEPETPAERLERVGASEDGVERGGRLLVSCARALRDLGIGAERPALAFMVPGRVEVLGKHTDYGGGRSLLAAVERGFYLVAVPRTDDEIHLLDLERSAHVRFRLEADLQPGKGWVNYPMTVARRVARNFPSARTGATVAFVSNLPPASGMSSSSALIIATFLVLSEVNRLPETEAYRRHIHGVEDLAAYASTLENGRSFGGLTGDLGVGTQGGSQDHTAILCSRPDQLVQYAFSPVRFERSVDLPAGHGLVIASSGVRAEKTGAAMERYNLAAELMEAATALWRAASGRDDAALGSVLDGDPEALGRVRSVLERSRHPRFPSRTLLDRVEHFAVEFGEIIPRAADAVARGDLAEFGALVDRSQARAERLLGNQVEETVFLARAARDLGAAAASAFGAGFGGSVWALVEDGRAADFQDRWLSSYRQRFPQHADEAVGFRTRSGPPATRLA